MPSLLSCNQFFIFFFQSGSRDDITSTAMNICRLSTVGREQLMMPFYIYFSLLSDKTFPLLMPFTLTYLHIRLCTYMIGFL